jgi:predicted Rossmann fold flavoprotein
MADEYDVAVIGAGAAGLLAATRAALRGRRTVLLEKNRKPGVKILMSGGTRCNLTHATDARGIVAAFGRQGPFLHSALAALPPEQLVELFHEAGVATKVEPGGKIFPVSDRAVDVLDALLAMLDRSGAQLRRQWPVTAIQRDAGGGYSLASPAGSLSARSVILAVGGQSYPGCGTTGDGYAWARSLGHAIVPPRPALAALTSPEPWVHQLRGVTIDDVELELACEDSPGGASVESPPKRSAQSPSERRRGSLLFTHFGLSGPAPMNASRAVTARPQARWTARCDFLPATPTEKLVAGWSDAASRAGKRTLLVAVAELVPRRLAEALLARAGIPADLRLAELSRTQRSAAVAALKATAIPIDGTLGFKKAEVTAGGVALDEVDSRTMQSKLSPRLYLAGEILDLDGPIGGYNFQAAFSTGALAGEKA